MTDSGRVARRRAHLENAMRAFVEAKGVPKDAAARFGVTEKTMKKLITEYCTEYRFATPVEAAYRLGQRTRIAA